MKATALLLCIVLVLNPLLFAAKGPELPQLDEPSMMNGQHHSLYGAWARYSKGAYSGESDHLNRGKRPVIGA